MIYLVPKSGLYSRRRSPLKEPRAEVEYSGCLRAVPLDSSKPQVEHFVGVGVHDPLPARGWLGTRRYTDTWDGLDVWWHIGYPADLNSQQRPVYQSWFAMNGDDTQEDAHQVLRHQADVFPGQSGGPMFGFWDDGFPYAVAVQSWQDGVNNGASGGGDLVDLAIRALTENP